MSQPPSTVKTLLKKVLRIGLLVVLFMAMAGIGTYVTLTLIIKGEDTVVVPDLVGKDVLYSLEILSDLGLNTRVRAAVYHDQVPQNHIIGQDPEAGSSIKKGRHVKIRVSRGPETIIMPNLVGLSLQQGHLLLSKNGLCQGAVSSMFNSRTAADRVFSQYPPPGTAVIRKTCADLLVSRGPPNRVLKMDDLTGFTLETAIGQLERLQLQVGTIRYTHTTLTPIGTIVDQVPLAGYRAVQGDPVDLIVNKGHDDQYSEKIGNADQVALFRFALENGFLKKRVQVKITLPQMSVSLFDEFMTPGQEIWLLVPRSGNPTVLVYVDGQLVQTRMMDGS